MAESGIDRRGIAQLPGCDQVLDRVSYLSMTGSKEAGVRLFQGEDKVERDEERGSLDEIGAAGSSVDTR